MQGLEGVGDIVKPEACLHEKEGKGRAKNCQKSPNYLRKAEAGRRLRQKMSPSFRE